MNMKPIRAISFLIALFITDVCAQQTVPYASHCDTSVTPNLCIAINVPQSATQDLSNDLYISITGPASLTWSGIGLGKTMARNLFFIVLPDATKKNVTISVRTAPSNVMPVKYSATNITTEVLAGSSADSSSFVANWVCRNCRSWSTGQFATDSSAAPIIYAFNKNSVQNLQNPDQAVIQYHGSSFGEVNLNLQAATAPNVFGIPGSILAQGGSSSSAAIVPISSSSGSSGSQSGTQSRQNLRYAHAVLMSLGFVLILGAGAIVIRFLSSRLDKPVKIHYSIQSVGLLFIIVGVILGIVASKDEHFIYSHQTFGTVLMVLVFVQAAGGILHHILYIRGNKTKVGLAHRYMGRALLVGAIINIGLALRIPNIAVSKAGQVAWYVVMLGIVLLYAIANIVMELKTGRNTGAEEKSNAKHKNGQHIPLQEYER